MKIKTILTLTLITSSALLIGACTPLEEVSTQLVPAASSTEAVIAAPTEVIVESALVPAAQPAMPTNYGRNRKNDSNNTQDWNGNNLQQEDYEGVPSFISTGELSQTELEGLSFMREEEKLARDVYLVLYDLWGLPLFQNIASSEQQHTDAVKGLLDLYGATDPVTDDTIGVFADDHLQDLYDQLVTKGNISLVDALEVGTAIEEIDILDLQEFLAETDNPNIIIVYTNLLRGSYNHLSAFVSLYEGQTGESFEPSYMTLDGYNDAILSASSGGYGGGRGGHGGRGKN